MSVELQRTCTKFFNINYKEWQEIQGSKSMDFPADFDELMFAIEAWLLGRMNLEDFAKEVQKFFCISAWAWHDYKADEPQEQIVDTFYVQTEAWLTGKVSIAERVKRVDELLGSISLITTGQGARANTTWDEIASLLSGIRQETGI